MPSDPVGVHSLTVPVIDLSEDESFAPDWYDRSSLRGDFMVMIAGQTEEEYLRRSPDHGRCEFVDGTVYMPPSVHANHQFDQQWLLCLISCFHARRPIGVVQSGPTALKLRDGCWLEPDLFVLPVGSREQISADGFARPPVLLAVEVFSPSTRSHDLVVKSALYREANVAEVWFIDRRERAVIVEVNDVDGSRTERIETGPVISRSLPGFWFDVGWLWAVPEPNLLDCVERVLAGPPRS